MARVFVFKIPNFVHVCPNPCTIYTQKDVIIFQYLFFTPYYYQLTTVGENHPYGACTKSVFSPLETPQIAVARIMNKDNM